MGGKVRFRSALLFQYLDHCLPSLVFYGLDLTTKKIGGRKDRN